MLIFDQPWLFLVLLAPLAVRALLPPFRDRKAALRSPFFDELAHAAGLEPSEGSVVEKRSAFASVVLALCWLTLVTALARPQWVEDPITKIESARDLMLAVDLSGSMDTRDFIDADGDRIDRLSAVKLVLDDFVNRRETDRLGLILFGNAAFLQVPFTLDHSTFRTLLAETRVGMAGPQTMMGDALGLAIKLFDASEVEQRLLILLTDGNDTGSKVPPPKAAQIAADNGITIHTIGVGDPSAAGEAPLDEATLQGIASTTGGQFFRANDSEELEAVYASLDELEPLEFESSSYRPKRELFMWPLAAFLVLGLFHHLAMAFRTRRPNRARPSASARSQPV